MHGVGLAPHSAEFHAKVRPLSWDKAFRSGGLLKEVDAFSWV